LFNNSDSSISREHLINKKKFNQLKSLSAKIDSPNPNKYMIEKQPLYKNQSLVCLTKKLKPVNRRSFDEHYGSIKDEMR